MRSLFPFILVVLPFIVNVSAQSSGWQWAFGSSVSGQQLTECQTVPLVVKSTSSGSASVGVPPYYMLAFEVDGVPTTTEVGTDPSTLSWQVKHKRGSVLMLAMLDANGSTGGVAAQTYNVIEGADTSCLPTSSSSSAATMSSNLTNSISTCQPWGLTIEGGKKPYTVVLSTLTSSVITNFTMKANDDVFTYISRDGPGAEVMASVVDATGQWGTSSGLLRTEGSDNTTCPGLFSSSHNSGNSAGTTASGTATSPPSSTSTTSTASTAGAATGSQQATHQNTGLILGLALGLGIPALLCVALIVLLFLRRGAQERTRRHLDLYMPSPWLLFKRGGPEEGQTPDVRDMAEKGVSQPPTNAPPSAGSSEAVPAHQVPVLPSNTAESVPRSRKQRQVEEAHLRAEGAPSEGSSSGEPVASMSTRSGIENTQTLDDVVSVTHELPPPPYETVSAQPRPRRDNGNV